MSLIEEIRNRKAVENDKKKAEKDFKAAQHAAMAEAFRPVKAMLDELVATGMKAAFRHHDYAGGPLSMAMNASDTGVQFYDGYGSLGAPRIEAACDAGTLVARLYVRSDSHSVPRAAEFPEIRELILQHITRIAVL